MELKGSFPVQCHAGAQCEVLSSLSWAQGLPLSFQGRDVLLV